MAIRPLSFVLAICSVWQVTSCGTEEVTFPPPAARDMSSAAEPDNAGDIDAAVDEGPVAEPTFDADVLPSADAELAAPVSALPTTQDAAPTPPTHDPPESEPLDAASFTNVSDAGTPPLGPACDRFSPTPARPSCERLDVVPMLAASTTQVGSSVDSVLDGDPCTSWRSTGAPPQWLTVRRCVGQRCTRMPRVGTIGLLVEGGSSRSITVEVQGATNTGAANGAFYTISSTTFPLGWKQDDYVELSVNVDPPEVMRILVNSGPATPVVIREMVFFNCD